MRPIVTNSGGATSFLDSSSAGSATLTTTAGPRASASSSSAATATVITNNGGSTAFTGSSSGGEARFVTNAGGAVVFGGLTTSGTTAGSIEGAGRYRLGDEQLTVGSNNLSTEVSGVISGNGGSLVKVGTGTLTLSGADTYGGGTTVNAGILRLGTGGSLAARAGRSRSMAAASISTATARPSARSPAPAGRSRSAPAR